MKTVRVLVAATVVLALLGSATGGVAVADGGNPDVDCGGLHEADQRTDGTAAESRLDEHHHECHEGEFPK